MTLVATSAMAVVCPYASESVRPSSSGEWLGCTPPRYVAAPVRGRAPSPVQQRLLDYVRKFRDAHGYPPAMREICAHFRWRSTNTVSGHLHALERRGYVEIEPGKSRGIRLVPQREGT